MDFSDRLVERTKRLCREVDGISFSYDGFIYNPLDYTWDMHEAFLRKYAKEGASILFLGMNPGPFGMMQTGVPFGEVNAVRDYLKLDLPVGKPCPEHPSRPVLGMAVKRSEGSGKRLWGLISQRWPDAADFFTGHCVFNYCPLGFLDKGKTAKNFTPDHLPKEERLALEAVCDSYLKDVIDLFDPKALIGVGKYAEQKLKAVNDDSSRIVASIIHPSPGNPQANCGWNEKTTEKMKELGLWK
ncbi:MAG: single-stranded DNA-binding protein [Spirochaetales bacterium]|nr:single-stranded DNA-binding protein [Spirochaetales bacterium]